MDIFGGSQPQQPQTNQPQPNVNLDDIFGGAPTTQAQQKPTAQNNDFMAGFYT